MLGADAVGIVNCVDSIYKVDDFGRFLMVKRSDLTQF